MNTIDEPQFSLSRAAKACGIPLTSLQNHFNKGDFRIIGDAHEAERRGRAHQFSARDIVGIGIALELMRIARIPGALAFEIGATKFAGSGNHEREPGKPFDVYEHGETVILFWPDSGNSRIIPLEKVTQQVLFERGRSQSAIIVKVNILVNGIYESLGFKE